MVYIGAVLKFELVFGHKEVGALHEGTMFLRAKNVLHCTLHWGIVALETFPLTDTFSYLLKSIPGVIRNIRDRCLFSFLFRFVKKPDSTCSQKNI